MKNLIFSLKIMTQQPLEPRLPLATKSLSKPPKKRLLSKKKFSIFSFKSHDFRLMVVWFVLVFWWGAAVT